MDELQHRLMPPIPLLHAAGVAGEGHINTAYSKKAKAVFCSTRPPTVLRPQRLKLAVVECPTCLPSDCGHTLRSVGCRVVRVDQKLTVEVN